MPSNVAHGDTEMSVNSTEDSEMHRAATVPNASELMKELWPAALGSVKERITKAARDLKWTLSRTEDMWRAEARIITGEETVRLHEVRLAKEQRREDELRQAARNIEETADDYREVADRLARLEALFVAYVAAQAGPQMAAQVARAAGQSVPYRP